MRRPGWRFWLWLAALGLLATAAFDPRWTLPRPVHRYLAVVDITQSMNTRDYHRPGLPNDRLGFVKASLEQALVELPCGTELGLAIFTHKNAHVLLTPLEICAHGAALRDALRAIDWRSAWAADSYIAYGLFDAVRTARTLKSGLIFFTDGDPVPATTKQPPFRGKPGQVKGWIVGVGGLVPTPIPKLDLEGHLTGYWRRTDLPRSVQSPRFVRQIRREREGLLLSRLHEEELRRLAELTGLRYHRLTTPQALTAALSRPETAELRPTALPLRPWLIGFALTLALATLV
ncbi:mxaL protein [Methylomarinovum caldicuralii]|uniref:MxaL protein n=1 Tax=Methylomarinovum caldicuralii TaxID=438856 RepID=A0AAU9CRE4_9GAMM|nr:vWA domain-containing protein [Methylomarinovum caldicuralii]BCX82538.1 mxaL protein [Methylomarinovum caldicuralii]